MVVLVLLKRGRIKAQWDSINFDQAFSAAQPNAQVILVNWLCCIPDIEWGRQKYPWILVLGWKELKCGHLSEKGSWWREVWVQGLISSGGFFFLGGQMVKFRQQEGHWWIALRGGSLLCTWHTVPVAQGGGFPAFWFKRGRVHVLTFTKGWNDC